MNEFQVRRTDERAQAPSAAEINGDCDLVTAFVGLAGAAFA